MSKLKTLKDLEFDTDADDDSFRYIKDVVIKQEAIKWYHRSDGNKHKFIREFFNITEEELKDAKSEDSD